jgi:nucleotidyltransferase substrate binding protein (TIGR01987 family)
MAQKDIRWEQRFANYRKALSKFNQAVEILKSTNDNLDGTELEEVIKEGLIQRFEYTHELAWKVMKDYAEYQGSYEIKGSRDATREAFQMKLINQADSWMDMIESRNYTSHTYNEETAEEIIDNIISVYADLFNIFELKMASLSNRQERNLFNRKL